MPGSENPPFRLPGERPMIAPMNSRFAFAAPCAALLASAALHAQSGSMRQPADTPKPVPGKPSPPSPADAALVRVMLSTAMGPIVIEVDRGRAPITANNFLRYVDQRRLDGTVFYRAMHLKWGTQPNGLLQGGTQNDPKRVLKPIAHEPTNVTGLVHKAGAVSMARWAPGTATGDFSIMLSDQPGLDAKPGGPGDNAGYAVFGRVVEGMDVVRKIFDSPISATKGEGVMRGQMLEAPVKIVWAKRMKWPVEPRMLGTHPVK